MSKISIDLPVKLDELLQFSFNFNNLIKIIDYLHQNNISLQQDIKDLDKRLTSMESLRNDIEDLKIKSSSIEKTNDNLNRSFNNLQEKILKYEQNFSEIQNKTKDLESKLQQCETVQSDNEQKINNLDKKIEDNVNTSNKLNDQINENSKTLSKITAIMEEGEKKDKEEFSNVNKNIKDIISQFEEKNKEIENISNNMGEMNESIKNIMNNFEKNNSDINGRILNIINDIAKINNNILNINSHISSNINRNDDKSSTNYNYNYSNNKYGKEISVSLSHPINNEISSNSLFKIAMDDLEEEKNKLNKFKEDYELFKDNQKKENESINKNIKKLKEEINSAKSSIAENEENIENIQNNLNDYINLQKEEKEHKEENERLQNDKTDLSSIKILDNKYVKIEMFKKLSDNVRILTSTMNTKTGREEMETQLKKLNQRIEDIEMIQQGQTHGPKTRIDLSLVNLPFRKKDSSSSPKNSQEAGEMNEIDYFAKLIENKINGDIINIINKEIKNIDLSLNPKINELINNNNKNSEDIEKNNKAIIDIKNIILSNPSQKDFVKLKNELEGLEDAVKSNKIKILELTKNIEGTEEDDEEEDSNHLVGTIKDKINFLNRTCQTLSTKLISLENKHKSITKEVKDDIKQNLKNETAKIMGQFKQRLESFTNKFEHELKNKIDQIGLSDFEIKMNNKFHIDLKEKLDKKELNKNNNMIKRKIDNLENKISKTLVDTIIDLQMDDQPLLAKKNGIGVDYCASCNQPFSRNSYLNGDYYSGNISNINTNMSRKNLNRSLLNFTQPSNIKSNNQNNERNLNILNNGNNKLPDIIPSIHPK